MTSAIPQAVNMIFDPWFFLVAVYLVVLTQGQGHVKAIETYFVSEGHFLQLKCMSSNVSDVNWKRKGSNIQKIPSGLEIRGTSLWFLPVQFFHNGSYSCEGSDGKGSWEMEFMVSVSTGVCPSPAEVRSITNGTSDVLPCKQDSVLRLDPTGAIRWLKNCRPVNPHGGSLISGRQHIRFYGASERDEGLYTCLIDFNIEGKNYTASRSIWMTINYDSILILPVVTHPKEEKVVVKLGSKLELQCSALLGYSEDEETLMYWTVNGDFSDTYAQLNPSWDYIHKRTGVYGLSNLSISEVLPAFLDVPIQCHAKNALGHDMGQVCLQAADSSLLYTCVALSLALFIFILAVGICCFFKVDLVLADRKWRPRLLKKTTPDGKVYDAYVCYVHPDGEDRGSSPATTFALQTLPEVMERRHGYTLYIRGRDDAPGEAVHDAIAELVGRCRRLIMVLASHNTFPLDPKSENVLPLRQSTNQLGYEQRIGLYDALTQNGPCVILVEIDAHVDYTRLPESLRYVRRKHGALRWRSGSGVEAVSRLNGHFWKCLRYRMPSIPGGGV